MKIEEAIVYCLASSGRGLRTEQIADMINRQRLHLRKDGQSVTSKQVYAVISRYPEMFVNEGDNARDPKKWETMCLDIRGHKRTYADIPFTTTTHFFPFRGILESNICVYNI